MTQTASEPITQKSWQPLSWISKKWPSDHSQTSIRTPDMHSWEALFITQEPVEQAHVGVAAGRWIARAYADEALARRAEDPVLHRIAIAAAGVVVQRAVDFEEMDRPVVTVLVEHH